jgi:uncharacterized protein (TIGR02246 family)
MIKASRPDSERYEENPVNAPLNSDDRTTIETLVATLEAAWNAGDADAFAAPFTDDADFVNIRAEHFRGRPAVAAGHAAIFRTIYAGSTNDYTLSSSRLLSADIALVHVTAILDAPSGPLAGRNRALFSMVLMRAARQWQIASFHNTLEPPAPNRG